MKFIGISGGTCSGKTTLCRKLSEILGQDLVALGLDSYYKKLSLPYEERAKINHDLPETLDWQLLRDHIDSLLAGSPVEKPVYSYREHNRTSETITVTPARIIILEGIHSFYDKHISKRFDLKIFIDSTKEIRKQRRLARDLVERCPDPEYVINKLENQTEKIFEQYVQQYRQEADFIVSSVDEGIKITLAHSKF